jgi:acid stress-induced BolA-like protein IbaG/YrbA
MNEKTILDLITTGLPCVSADVTGDGRHWNAVIVSEAFRGKRLIQRHQMVYATLGNKMQTDEIHALSMKTLTPEEASA